MFNLMISLLIGLPAWAAVTKLPERCETALDHPVVRDLLRMRTLRTIPSHQNGEMTPHFREVLDQLLPDLLPPNERPVNETPLPYFEVKAELKLPEEKTKHQALILKLDDGSPIALVKIEGPRGEEIVTVIPLGTPAVSELRDTLLTAYQILPPLTGHDPDSGQLLAFALLAEDRHRLTPDHPSGVQATTYADHVQWVTPNGELTWRVAKDGASIIRHVVDDTEAAHPLSGDHFDDAVDMVRGKLERELVESTNNQSFLKIFFGEDEKPSFILDGPLWINDRSDLVELFEKEVKGQPWSELSRADDGTRAVKLRFDRLRKLILAAFARRADR